MRAVKKAGLAVGSALALVAVPAHAVSITIDSGWQPFIFYNDSTTNQFDQTFDFTLVQSAKFSITDAFYSGDQFRIFINGTDSGLTSSPVDDGTQLGDNYDAAFASAKFSHASYLLGPGKYTISGTVEASATDPGTGLGFESGGGGFRLDSVVSAAPEPATWAMMLAGFGIVGFALRSRRVKARARAIA